MTPQKLDLKSNKVGHFHMARYSFDKQEIYYGYVYHSLEELQDAIETYIRYYHEEQIKSSLGWMSPVEFRLRQQAA